jgi:hypothetical protein
LIANTTVKETRGRRAITPGRPPGMRLEMPGKMRSIRERNWGRDGRSKGKLSSEFRYEYLGEADETYRHTYGHT